MEIRFLSKVLPKETGDQIGIEHLARFSAGISERKPNQRDWFDQLFKNMAPEQIRDLRSKQTNAK